MKIVPSKRKRGMESESNKASLPSRWRPKVILVLVIWLVGFHMYSMKSVMRGVMDTWIPLTDNEGQMSREVRELPLPTLTGNPQHIHCEDPETAPVYDTIVSTASSLPARRIPRIIHVSFNHRCAPKDIADGIDRWRKAFPNHSLYFHDDDAVDRLLSQHWPEFPHLQLLLNCVKFKGAMKIDIWRILVVYKYGGIYTDIDNVPGPKMNEGTIQSDDSFFSLSDGWTRPCQNLFAMEPGHPVLFYTMHQIFTNLANLDSIRHPRVVFVTGPQALVQGYRRFMGGLPDSEIMPHGVYHGMDGKQARKIGKKQTGQYMMSGLGNSYGDIVSYKGKNMTRRERVEAISNIPHWTKQRLKSNETDETCLKHLYRLNSAAFEKEQATADSTQSVSSSTAPADDGTNVAYKHSFGLFHDIPNADWEKLRQKVKSTSWYANPDDPLEKVDDGEWWNQHNLIPNFDCPDINKIGEAEHEGTKLVCSPQRLVREEKQDCLVYSFGCAGSFKFEDSIFKLHNKACEIHVFDPANWERKNDKAEKNIHYHAWGLVSTYDSSKSVVWPKGRGGAFKTFPETLEILGHQNRTIDIFKIDCEGCEWSSIDDWIGIGAKQILVETHGVPTPQGTPNMRWYQKPMDVSQYYGRFRDNGYALYSKDMFGKAVELSFIKLHYDFWA